MPRGRPPAPIEHHQRTGRGPGKKANGSPLMDGALALVPKAEPSMADRSPAAAFEAIMVDAQSYLAQTDMVALSLLRESLEERTEVRARALAGSSEARTELRALDKQIVGLLSACGFDPTARARLGWTTVKAQSKFEQMQSRRARD